MPQLAGSLYLLSTIAFGLVALVVGAKLVSLSRRTGRAPERLLGFGLALTASSGYMLMIIGMAGSQAVDADGAAAQAMLGLILFGWVSHNLGLMCMLAFIVVVFHEGRTWARALGVAGCIVLWTGWGAYVQSGAIVTGRPVIGYWVAFSVIGTYPIWMGINSFRYHVRMRRRAALGLADPILVNRFLLWGLGSIGASLSMWTVNIPNLVKIDLGSPHAAQLATTCLIATAFFGIATVSFYWLAFMPPAWFRARFDPAHAST